MNASLPTIGPVTIGFANLGRNKDRAHVKAAMKDIRTQLNKFDCPWVMNFVEMDEGDKGYKDHKLLQIVFPRALKIGMDYKNVILVGGGAKVLKRYSKAGSKGVHRWSPARRIVGGLIELPTGGSFEDYCLHLPAGAHNGTRPVLVRKLLQGAYKLVDSRFRKRLSNGIERDVNQTYGIDANNKAYPRYDHTEVSLQRNPPDYLRAIPARKYKVVIHEQWWIETGIEAHHDALFATISFVPKSEVNL